MMKLRPLGKTDLRVSEIGFGGWGIGKSMWGETDDELSRNTLRKAIEVGINFFDTAYVYGDGHSEKIIGSVIGREENLYVATKVPPADRDWPAQAATSPSKAYPKKWIIECTERSLENLNRERIDLQQLHVWHDAWVDADEWRDAAETLKKQGKIHFFGVSINDHEPETALKVVQTGLIDSVQVIYNLFEQFPADELFPLCEKHKVGVIARVPFDEGSLTGTFKPDTRFDPADFRRDYFGGGRLKKALERIEEIKEDLPRDDQDNLAAGALTFCLSHPAVSTVIPGMRRPDRVIQNAAISGRKLYDVSLLKQLRRHAWKRNFYEFVL